MIEHGAGAEAPMGQAPAGRLALLGGESSGKTTLARALAERLGSVWVPEYGRQRWEELRQTLDVDELLAVARRQVELEDEAMPRARGWLVCDTTPLTTLQYCLHDHGSAPRALWTLSRRRYALAVVCAPDFDFVQDGCRRDDAFRARQHAWTLEQLSTTAVPSLVVHGAVDRRIEQVLTRLAALGRPPVAVRCRRAPAAGVPRVGDDGGGSIDRDDGGDSSDGSDCSEGSQGSEGSQVTEGS